MEYNDADPSFRARFVEPKFDPNTFIQSIGELHRLASSIDDCASVQLRNPSAAPIWGT